MSTTTVESTHFQTRWSELSEPSLFALTEAPVHYLAPRTKTYYRSKAFVSQIGINPLVAASSPLFFLVDKIATLTTMPNLENLRSDLIHEIHAFEHQAQARDYRPYVILAARYALCLWIDETILNTTWGKQSNWSTMQLTDIHETTHANSFFVLLNRCLQEPSLYIDLLELLYLCMSFGMQGDYRHMENGQTQLMDIREQLFETICQQRDHVSKQLEINATTTVTRATFSWYSLLRPAVAACTLLSLVASYFMLDARLAAAFTTVNTPPAISSTPALN